MDLSPLAHNEFICWVEDAMHPETRRRRIRRTQEDLEDGPRRPAAVRIAPTEIERAARSSTISLPRACGELGAQNDGPDPGR